MLTWSEELAASRTYHTEHGPEGTMRTVADALTYATIEAWARLTKRDPTPLEVETLFRLDFIQRHPDDPDDAGGHDDAAAE